MSGGAPRIAWISSDDPPEAFPAVESAFAEPDGLLAAGGDLSPERLLYAYRHGIFPWYDDGQPILWWSPDPRCVLRPSEFHAGSRLRRHLKKSGFEVTFNASFEDVISACAESRLGQPGTWITAGMHDAYAKLHDLGWAQSVEIWSEGSLVGGVYGLFIGGAFFGESMFSRSTNASKAAMLALCKRLQILDVSILDCQVESPHLTTLGAITIPRSEFADILKNVCVVNTPRCLQDAENRPIADYL
jgi:leucyl/phenylalanyl-tRNA--protein transferase